MATITIDTNTYNNVKIYAESHDVSVEGFIVSLINKFVPSNKKYKMKSVEELSPKLQAIIGFAKPQHFDDDINGEKARMQYLYEKYEQ